MTVAELIDDVLRRIASTDFYHGRPREFMRDQRSLQRAIARYGYECHKSGWEFSTADIQRDLVALLREIVEKNAPIEYFPIYLEGAVDRHIRQRAEELQAKAKAAKATKAIVPRLVQGTEVVRVIEPTPVEVLGTLYKSLKRPKKKKMATAKQGALL